MALEGFRGAKVALFFGTRLIVMRRDDIPGIDWPGRLDLPGGGRDPGETPEACVLRETLEEIGLSIPPERLVWRRRYPRTRLPSWFFAGRVTETETREMRLGDEGQWLGLMETEDFLAAQDGIPRQQAQVRDVLADPAFG